MQDGIVNEALTSPNSVIKEDNNYPGFGIIWGDNVLKDTKINQQYPNVYTIEFAADCQEFVIRTNGRFKVYADEGEGYRTVGSIDDQRPAPLIKISFKDKAKRNIRLDW